MCIFTMGISKSHFQPKCYLWFMCLLSMVFRWSSSNETSPTFYWVTSVILNQKIVYSLSFGWYNLAGKHNQNKWAWMDAVILWYYNLLRWWRIKSLKNWCLWNWKCSKDYVTKMYCINNKYFIVSNEQKCSGSLYTKKVSILSTKLIMNLYNVFSTQMYLV